MSSEDKWWEIALAGSLMLGTPALAIHVLLRRGISGVLFCVFWTGAGAIFSLFGVWVGIREIRGHFCEFRIALSPVNWPIWTSVSWTSILSGIAAVGCLFNGIEGQRRAMIMMGLNLGMTYLTYCVTVRTR
jgi:hypothetical protein